MSHRKARHDEQEPAFRTAARVVLPPSERHLESLSCRQPHPRTRISPDTVCAEVRLVRPRVRPRARLHPRIKTGPVVMLRPHNNGYSRLAVLRKYKVARSKSISARSISSVTLISGPALRWPTEIAGRCRRNCRRLNISSIKYRTGPRLVSRNYRHAPVPGDITSRTPSSPMTLQCLGENARRCSSISPSNLRSVSSASTFNCSARIIMPESPTTAAAEPPLEPAPRR